MMSLWSLLTPRAPMRRFALLDASGTCRALRETRELPGEPGWVEVRELRTQWLGQALPLDVLVTPRRVGTRPSPALAA